MMSVELDYTTSFLTISDQELQKTGKLNSNTFAIAEIGGSFAANTLKYEGFMSSKNDIGQYPWSTSISLTYDPSGHYRQQVVWDQTLDSSNGRWKTDSNVLVAESTTF
jgi:phage tail sheath protein FI